MPIHPLSLRRRVLPLFAAALTSASLAGHCLGQLIYSEILNNGSMRVMQRQANGQVTPINTGFGTTNFAGLSRDGRFLTFSVPDPQDPSGPVASSDLYLFDRGTNTPRRLLNQETDEVAPIQSVRQFGTYVPVASQLSPDGQNVVFTNQLTLRNIDRSNPRSSRNLNIQPTDGRLGATIEAGSGDRFDLLRSEFVGISFAPDGSFATSAYITVPSPIGLRPAAAIVRYAPTGPGGSFQRVAALSTPTLSSPGAGLSASIQAFPAFSPSGNGLAYFDLFYPDASLLSRPATARLIVANADGSGARVVTQFSAGLFPVGLGWSPDGNSLVFSIGNQGFSGGSFGPFAVPETAVLRSVAIGGGTPTQIPGVNNGFLPAFPLTGGGGTGSVDLSQAKLSLTRGSDGRLLLRALSGLDPDAEYVLESSSGLSGFGSPFTTTGQQLMGGGISIPIHTTRQFFRIREP